MLPQDKQLKLNLNILALTENHYIKYVLFASLAVEETSPLKAGLLASNPENRGDSHNQHHQVLDEEEDQVGATGVLHLQERKSRTRTGHWQQCGKLEDRTASFQQSIKN